MNLVLCSQQTDLCFTEEINKHFLQYCDVQSIGRFRCTRRQYAQNYFDTTLIQSLDQLSIDQKRCKNQYRQLLTYCDKQKNITEIQRLFKMPCLKDNRCKNCLHPNKIVQDVFLLSSSPRETLVVLNDAKILDKSAYSECNALSIVERAVFLRKKYELMYESEQIKNNLLFVLAEGSMRVNELLYLHYTEQFEQDPLLFIDFLKSKHSQAMPMLDSYLSYLKWSSHLAYDTPHYNLADVRASRKELLKKLVDENLIDLSKQENIETLKKYDFNFVKIMIHDGQESILDAVASNNTKIVKLYDFNKLNGSGSTLLHAVSNPEYIEKMQLLLENKLDILLSEKEFYPLVTKYILLKDRCFYPIKKWASCVATGGLLLVLFTYFLWRVAPTNLVFRGNTQQPNLCNMA